MFRVIYCCLAILCCFIAGTTSAQTQLTLSDEIVVSADGVVLPFGDSSNAATSGPANGAEFRYTVRERQNAGQTDRKIVTFLEFDTSSLTLADVNNTSFSALFMVEHVGHLNAVNTSMDLTWGRNVSGAWDSVVGGDPDPLYAWAAASSDQAVILDNIHLVPDSQVLSLDITSTVKGWVDGSFDNQGLVLFGTNGGGNNFSQASYLVDPQVIVTIPEPSAFGVVGLAGLGVLFRRRR